MLNRRRFLILSGTALAGAAGTVFYAWQIEPHLLEVVRRRMPLEGLPDALVGKTLLQISDIHVGHRVDPEYLIHSFCHAQESLTPDFVAVTGDFVTYQSAQEYRGLARVLKHLPRGRIATVASFGNHDYGLGWQRLDIADQVTSVVSDAGAVVLRNESLIVAGLQFAGLSDVWSPEFGPFADRVTDPQPKRELQPWRNRTPRKAAVETLRGLAREFPTIVLSHNPDVQDLPIWDGFRGWALAGHTHGGQVKPPFLPPPLLPVRNKRYIAGEFALGGGRTLYINRGLGHLFQLRFNVRPEITLFTLERAVDAP